MTVIAAGVEVAQALEAKELLAAEGISAEVVDAFSIKPFDKETLLASVKKTGCVVTCEEHSTVGGLGSAVADILGENYPVPLERVGVRLHDPDEARYSPTVAPAALSDSSDHASKISRMSRTDRDFATSSPT